MRKNNAAPVVFLIIINLLACCPDASSFWWFDEPKDRSQAASEVPAVKAGLNLRGAYELALKRSETLAIQAQMIQEAQGRFYEALSVSLPTIDFVMTRFDQDAPPKGHSEGSESGLSGTASRPSTPQKKFTFHQPLFSGFKEFAAISGGKADKKAQELKYKRAKELLWMDVADSFYLLLKARQDLAVLKETTGIYDQRITELKQRVNLGRSRESEIQTAIADQKLNDAELARTRRLEITLRELFEFYIGRPLDGELVDDLDLGREISDVLYYLSKSNNRSDVRAAEQDHILAKANVVVAQAGFLPSIYLDGNAYTQRVGFQSGYNWDTTLTFNVPIFDGMATIGRVRQAASQREQSRWQLERIRRVAALEIQQKYDSYRASLEEEEAFYGAKEASKENYRLQAEDYQLNLVNNLDVLDALRRLKEISRQWNTAYYSAKVNYWALKTAAGEID